MRKLSVSLFVLAFTLIMISSTVSAGVIRNKDLVEDEAGVLSSAQVTELNALANRISEEYSFETAVVFVSSLNGVDVQLAAHDYYDNNGYGYGDNDDGILLLIAPNEREYAISSYAKGDEIFKSKQIGGLENAFIPFLSDNDWAGAANAYLLKCDTYLGDANKSSNPLRSLIWLPVDILIGIFAGGVPAASLRSQLKNVKEQKSAGNYKTPHGFELTAKQDMFIRTETARRVIPKAAPSAKSNTSSSGRTHGGSSGKF